MSTNLYNTF